MLDSDFMLWLENPCTERLFKKLELMKKDSIYNLCDSRMLFTEHSEKNLAKLHGGIEILDMILEMTLEDLFDDEEIENEDNS